MISDLGRLNPVLPEGFQTVVSLTNLGKTRAAGIKSYYERVGMSSH